jgi:hypothetical protein
VKAVFALAVQGKACVLSPHTALDVRWMNRNKKIHTDAVLFPRPAHVLVGDVYDPAARGLTTAIL